MIGSFEVAVVGLGAIGSQTLAALASRGISAIGLDRYAPPHDRGSSHGRSRLIRFAYFEHPDYVPLVRRAMQLWSDLERDSGRSLFVRTGLLQSGPPDSPLIAGIEASAAMHGLAIERPGRRETERRFPVVIPEGWPILFEHDAGYLIPELAIEAALSVAEARGATLLTDCAVRQADRLGNGWRVTTDRGELQAERLVLTVGPWTGEWRSLGPAPPTILRKHLFWYGCSDDRWKVRSAAPSFLFDTGSAYLYGMPDGDGGGVKIARHDGGVEVAPDDDDRRIGRDDEERDADEFAMRFLTGLSPAPIAHEICRYSMSPDGDFRLGDRDDGRVVWVSGLSGHGFKFATALGEQVAIRIETGTWHPSVRFLTARD